MKNLTTILFILSFAFAGYYMYSQSKNADLNLESGSALTQDMLANTQIFIERRVVLDNLALDTNIFDDAIFRSYRSFSNPVAPEPYGRDNPFVRTSNVNNQTRL